MEVLIEKCLKQANLGRSSQFVALQSNKKSLAKVHRKGLYLITQYDVQIERL